MFAGAARAGRLCGARGGHATCQSRHSGSRGGYRRCQDQSCEAERATRPRGDDLSRHRLGRPGHQERAWACFPSRLVFASAHAHHTRRRGLAARPSVPVVSVMLPVAASWWLPVLPMHPSGPGVRVRLRGLGFPSFGQS